MSELPRTAANCRALRRPWSIAARLRHRLGRRRGGAPARLGPARGRWRALRRRRRRADDGPTSAQAQDPLVASLGGRLSRHPTPRGAPGIVPASRPAACPDTEGGRTRTGPCPRARRPGRVRSRGLVVGQRQAERGARRARETSRPHRVLYAHSRAWDDQPGDREVKATLRALGARQARAARRARAAPVGRRGPRPQEPVSEVLHCQRLVAVAVRSLRLVRCSRENSALK